METMHKQLFRFPWDAPTTKPRGVRLIDEDTRSRTIPMRLLVLGMSRTGTFSMYTALQKLGYKPYHMAEAMNDPPRALGEWEEALKAKFFGEGKPFGKAEFDKIMGDFDATADLPSILFIDELITAYPDAKVILTNRDVDKWLVSMQNTAFEVISWPSWRWVAPWDSWSAGHWYSVAILLCQSLARDRSISMADIKSKKFGVRMREMYLEHYAHVRRVVKKENLLEFESRDGYGPLCEFLGVEVPKEEYPNINDSADFVFFHSVMWTVALGKMIAKTVLPVAVASGVYYIYGHGDSGMLEYFQNGVKQVLGKL